MFLLRPTARQDRAPAEMLDDHRVLYNAALQERRGAYRRPSAMSIRANRAGLVRYDAA